MYGLLALIHCLPVIVDCCKPAPLVVPLLLRLLHLAETKWVTHLHNSVSSRLLWVFSRPYSPERVEGEFGEVGICLARSLSNLNYPASGILTKAR